jgi:hypothetical protein
MTRILAGTLTVLGVLVVGSSASAVSLQIDGAGLLTGATGVVVNGDTYSVTFLDGSCISVFNGCDNAAEDFAFTTEALALSASQALLDSVFTGIYDDDPTLTFGCSSVIGCRVETPYRIRPLLSDFQVDVAYAANNSVIIANDALGLDPTTFTVEDTTTKPQSVWALWSPESAQQVPEAPTIVMLAAGLVGLGFIRRRARRTG